MTDDIVARLRALASEFPTLDGIMDSEWTNAADEIERLRRDYSCICNEMRRMMEERDEARMQTRRILNEIDCRIEHGAESNGHLEAIRNLLTENTDDR